MKLSAKGRYAIKAMINIALNTSKEPKTLLEIAKHQGISLSYLEQLFALLRKHNLVSGIRGPGGGYLVAKNHDNISVKNIISSVDEQIDATQCGGKENCNEGHQCITHNLWTTLNSKILDYLESTTLDELVKTQRNKSENQSIEFATNKNNSESNKMGAF